MNADARPHPWLYPLVILLITFGVHAPSIDREFVFDDQFNVSAVNPETGRNNEMIATLQPLSEYFSSHYLRGVTLTSRGYRPVTVLSYAATFHLFSGQPENDSATPHHAVNVLLQVANTLLVLLLLRRLADGWPVLLGTMVFALHSIHTEAIAGIVGRGELLGFGFGAASLLLFLRGIERSRSRRLVYLIAAGAAQFLAFCSKESALAWWLFVPLTRLALHYRVPSKTLRRDLLLGLAIGVIPVALFLIGRHVALDSLPPYHTSYLSNPIHGDYAPLSTRVPTATLVWAFAIYKVIAPFSLACEYGANVFELVSTWTDLRFWGAGMLLVGLVFAGVLGAKRHPLLFLTVACFFGFSFVVSNIPISQETIFAERNYYTPSLALSFFVVWLATRPVAGPLKQILVALLAAWLATAAYVDVQRMTVWQSNRTLFQNDARSQPRSIRILDNALGTVEPGSAEFATLIDRMLEVEPTFPKALVIKAGDALRAGDIAGAEELLEQCESSPLLQLIDYRQYASRMHLQWGLLRLEQEDPGRAIDSLDRAIQIDPAYFRARDRLVRELLRQDDIDRASKLIEEGRQIHPADPRIELLSGKHLLATDQPDSARQVLERALERIRGQHLDAQLDLVEAELGTGLRADARGRLETVGSWEASPAERARIEALRERVRR